MDSKIAVSQCKAIAPINIAVVKYWGKRDALLNLPTNSSLSVTLDPADLHACTTVKVLPTQTSEVKFSLNGVDQTQIEKRMKIAIDRLREERARMEANDSNLPKYSMNDLLIDSNNNFPTAAGLASSAAGYAALVKAVAGAFNLNMDESDLSVIARQGSGSACRSLMDGFVAWDQGKESDGTDSRARIVESADYWPTLSSIILVVSAEKKKVGSTSGMNQTVVTSELFQHRINSTAHQRMQDMEAAIKNKDFHKFAELTIKDSNQFHACCLDTFPPIFYLNDTSREIMQMAHELNESMATNVVAYTFDAGPNAVLFYEKTNEDLVINAIQRQFGDIDGLQSSTKDYAKYVPSTFTNGSIQFETSNDDSRKISRAIMTRVGQGAFIVN